MKNLAFVTLVELLNSTINILKKYNFKIYDKDNPSYYITSVEYVKESDELYFNVEEVDGKRD